MFEDEKYQKAADKALAFIKSQMDVSSFLYDISWGMEYSDEYEGNVMYGFVENLPSQDEHVYPSYINVDTFYPYSYTGGVRGTWHNLSNPSDYKVEVHVVTDLDYLVTTTNLASDGTWWPHTTEFDEKGAAHDIPIPVGVGCKYFVLVDSDGNVVDNAYSYFVNFRARIYSYSDAEYLADDVPIYDVGGGLFYFFTNKAYIGRKVGKVMQRRWRAGDYVWEVEGIAGAMTNRQAGRIPASFLIPSDDPNYDKDGSKALRKYGYLLNARCFIYDIGLALLVFSTSGDTELAKEIMQRMAVEQNEDGSFNFSYDLYIGKVFEGYVRTGSIGWLVWGMCNYVLSSGDHSFDEMIKKAGDWILTRQITSKKDERYGLLTGGYGRYTTPDYEYEAIEIEWCSTEHCCSSLQALSGLSVLYGDEKYLKASELLKASIFTKLWDKKNGRFLQGLGDGAWALDCTTWAGLASVSIVTSKTASICLKTCLSEFAVTEKALIQSTEAEHYNTTYSSEETFSGFRPYSERDEGYTDPPSIVWSEGTLGYTLLCMIQGNTDKAVLYMDEMLKLQDVENSTGGILYVTETFSSLPWEFHVWESSVSSAWLYLLVKNPAVLFPRILRKTTQCARFK